jgi:opacity protein-like surface antigen
VRKSSVALAALSAASLVCLASAAQASEQFNQDLAAPGVYFGTGNGTSPQEFTTNTADGVELGLRSKISGIHPQIVPTGDTYFVPLGGAFNFDYSFNPDVGGSEVSLTGLTALITVTDLLNGHTATFDPTIAALGDTLGDTHGAPGGYQNSEKISFGFIDPGFNANLNDTFHITYTVSGLADGPLTVTNTVILGSGVAVPEPASWALMMLGFGGIGAAMRRSRQVAAAATA